MSALSPFAPRLTALAVLLALTTVLAGCGSADDEDDSSSATAADTGSTATVSGWPVDRDEVESWTGAITLEYVGTPTDEGARVQESGYLDDAVARLGETVYLPEDVSVLVTDDPEIASSVYYYDENTLYYPWSDFDATRAGLATYGYEGDALDQAALNADAYFVVHELGYALMDLLQLPILGREDDSADNFADYFALYRLDAPELAEAGADYWGGRTQSGAETTDADFADSHSLVEQRYYTAVCAVYGYDSDAYDYLLEESGLPEERSEWCEDEYQSLSANWDQLLGPYLASEDWFGYGEDPGGWDGEFVVSYENEDASDEAAGVVGSGLIDQVVATVNSHVVLPEDVTIHVGADDPDGDGPYYYENEIFEPWSWAEDAREALDAFGYEGDELDAAVSESMAGTLIHEMGHALVAAYQLPVTGREEDAADAFEAYVSMNWLQDVGVVISDFDVSGSWSYGEVPDHSTYADEHATDAQRYYTAYCQVYGSDPETYGYLVEGDVWTEDRLANCEYQWQSVDYGWTTALAPYLT